MTTTTPTLGHSSLTGGRYPHTIDQLIARIGISLLRWANNRSARRALTHEAQSRLRSLEAELHARELAAQRLASMRVH